MSSEKPKPARDEKRLYEPIREYLQNKFVSSYIDEKRPRYQRAPNEYEENIYLELVGKTRRFSEKLQKELYSDTLSIIINEGIFPDIVGYVQRKPKDRKEIITVEVKDEPIKIKHIATARFYQDIFNATFGLLISSKEIPESIARRMLETEIGKVIRGQVIIAQAVEKRWGAQYADRRFMALEIDSRFKDTVPKPFKELCKP